MPAASIQALTAATGGDLTAGNRDLPADGFLIGLAAPDHDAQTFREHLDVGSVERTPGARAGCRWMTLASGRILQPDIQATAGLQFDDP